MHGKRLEGIQRRFSHYRKMELVVEDSSFPSFPSKTAKGLAGLSNYCNSPPFLCSQVCMERGWREYTENTPLRDNWNLWWKTSAFSVSQHKQLKAWQVRLVCFPFHKGRASFFFQDLSHFLHFYQVLLKGRGPTNYF